jgi:hypothetical protein
MESEYLMKRRQVMLGLRDPDLPKRPKPIPQKSEKQKSNDKLYKEKRARFMKEHPFCQAKLRDCTKIATELHHSKGRGEYLLDETTFVALCEKCHRYLEDHPAEAKKLKLSGSRLAIHDIVKVTPVKIIDELK